MSFLVSMDLPKEPIVTVHTTNNRGHTPEEIAARCVGRIVSISDNAHPAIQAQAREYRSAVEAVMVLFMKEAIQSDRTTVCNAIKDAGHPSLAEIIRRL
tara:strand:- start:16 stop:312 length:297 start_codon:yes stop_codon:yes gene_type:complete